ncbi:MAG: tetratricopeptide repeat protein [Bacteroidetes bacterium]|nr:MAG: tetratricopeptide repeat protein [Bacteroidota bacterium]
MSQTRLQQLLAFWSDSPEDSFLLFAIAKEYEKLGQLEEALSKYLELKKIDPNYIGLYYHLGKLYEARGAAQMAWDTYSEGIRVARQVGDQHALNELATARLNLGDEEDFIP